MSDDHDDEPGAGDVPERGTIHRPPVRRYRSVRRNDGVGARYQRLRRVLSIEQLLGHVIKRHGLTEGALEQCIAICWSEIISDPRIVQRARPTSLRNGVLKIGAASSVWVHELQLKKTQLLAAINGWLDAQRGWLGDTATVVDLRLGLDDRRHTIADLDHVRRLRLRTMRRRPPPDREPPPVPPSVRDSILSETSHIQDPGLRAIIEALRTTWGI